MFKRMSSIILALATTSCVHVNSVSLTQIPSTRSHQIKADTSKIIILGFNFDNDYVDKLNDDLKGQCPGGKVQGILTKDETTQYFMFFVIKRSVTATGYCNKA
jgi:hypothetical protein